MLARSVALAQRTQILVYSAVVLGDRHLVVVHHDDDACAQLRRLVETLERLTARERTVTDDGNDVLVRALYVARLLQTGGKTHGCGGVSHLEVVVLGAFRRRRVTRYGVHIVDIAEETCGATCKHLVRIALVADVEHELVHRRIEHVVQSHGRLNEAEVRTYVSAVLAHAVKHRRTCLVRHNVKRLYVQPFQVGWRLNLFYIHACFIFYVLRFSDCKVTHNVPYGAYRQYGRTYQYCVYSTRHAFSSTAKNSFLENNKGQYQAILLMF